MGLDNVLSRAQLSRRFGRFEESLTLLASESDMHAEVVFETFRVFEDMGELRKCLQCIENFHQNTRNTQQGYNRAKNFLLKLCAAYTACFVRGEWLNAMELALLAHRDYLYGRTSYDVTAVCALPKCSIDNELMLGRLKLKSIIIRFGSL